MNIRISIYKVMFLLHERGPRIYMSMICMFAVLILLKQSSFTVSLSELEAM